jgi:hypothetical protein
MDDAAGRCSMPSDSSKKPEDHPPDEDYKRLIQDANKALRRFQELNRSDTDRDKDELERLRRKLGKGHFPPKVSRAPKPPPPLSRPTAGTSEPAKFKPLASFDYAPGYLESHRARVARSAFEAVGMDQLTGIKQVMRTYLVGVLEAGTRAKDRWLIEMTEHEIDRFLRYLCIYQGRAQGMWSEPEEEVSHAVHGMPEYDATIGAVCAAWMS